MKILERYFPYSVKVVYYYDGQYIIKYRKPGSLFYQTLMHSLNLRSEVICQGHIFASYHKAEQFVIDNMQTMDDVIRINHDDDIKYSQYKKQVREYWENKAPYHQKKII